MVATTSPLRMFNLSSHVTPMAEFPAEFLSRPLPLVALVGLDVVHNAVHRMIWHTFAVERRPDRVPVNFQCLPGDHEYPKASPKVCL